MRLHGQFPWDTTHRCKIGAPFAPSRASNHFQSEPYLFAQTLVFLDFWGNFFLKICWILLLMVQVASLYLYSFGYNIFLKWWVEILQICMSPLPLHAQTIIFNWGPPYLFAWTLVFFDFWGNFFLKIFGILLLMVQIASFYLYSFGYNIFFENDG